DTENLTYVIERRAKAMSNKPRFKILTVYETKKGRPEPLIHIAGPRHLHPLILKLGYHLQEKLNVPVRLSL
ncbi:MAG: hypothetical protein V1658_01445, partial [Candidatus Micrarchaeota archaeon]